MNEFIARNGIIAQNNSTISGSLIVTAGITGSIFGSSSYAATSSYADNFTVAGTLTAQTLVVQTITSSVIYSSGSNVFGNSLSNTQKFTGSLYQTGSVAAFMGSVGIGTTNPGSKLEVVGIGRFTGAEGRSIVLEGNGAGKIDINGDGATYAVGIAFNSQLGGTTLSGIWDYGSGTTQNWLAVGGTSYNNAAMYILPSGNVGIGTTSPSAKLEILGNDDQIILNTAGTYSSIYFRNNGTSVGQLFSTNAATYLTTIGSRILYLGGGNGVTQITLDGTNVGIGTGSPVTKLQVVGGYISTKDNAAYGGAFLEGGNGISYFGSLGSDDIELYTGGATKVIIKQSTGNVGIGTTNPAQRLEVNGGDALIRTAYIGNISNFGTDYASFSHIARTGSGDYSFLSANNGTTYINAKTGANINFRVNNQDKAVITPAGSVGIGTDSPSQKLDVIGQAAIGSGAQAIVGTDGTYAGYSTIGFGGTTNGYNRVFGNAGTADGLYLASATGQGIYFWTNGANTRMHITPAGNVGVGITDPNGKLTVREVDTNWELNTSADGVQQLAYNRTISAYKYMEFRGSDFRFSPSDVEKVRINSSGDLLVGTATSIWASSGRGIAQVNGSSTSLIGLSIGDQAKAYLYHNGGDLALYTYTGNINLQNSNGSVLSVSGTNVGIGTTSPSYTLDVIGDARARGFIVEGGGAYASGSIYSDGNWGMLFRARQASPTQAQFMWATAGDTELMRINPAGRVGIGSTSPGYKLDVNGDGRFTGGLSLTSENPQLTFTDTTAGEDDMVLSMNGDYLEFLSNALRNIITVQGETSAYAGRVGIGTSSPGAKLHIASATDGPADTFLIESTIGNGAFAIRGLNTGNYVYQTFYQGSVGKFELGITPTNSDFYINPNVQVGPTGAAIYIKKSNGYVGVGTTSPTYNLHTYGVNPRNLIQDQSTGYPILQLNNNSGNFYMSIDNAAGTGFGSAYSRYIYSEGAYPMIFVTNDAERMRILSGGNIGIGTTSPYGKFQINASNYGESPTINKALLVSDSAAPSKYLILTYHATPDIGIIQGLHEGTAWKNIALNPNGANVGIGLTNPSVKLHVSAPSNDTSLILDHGSSTYRTYFGFDGTGNYIETNGGTTATQKLRLQVYNNSTTVYTQLYIDGGNNVIYTSATANVGIGVTNPGYKLEVNGGIYASNGAIRIASSNPFYFNDYGGGWYMSDSTWIRSYNAKSLWMDAGYIGGDGGLTIGYGGASYGTGNAIIAGRVGIGTTSPGYKLDVVGDTRAPRIYIDRGNNSASGISWYSAAYPGWTNYMAPAAQTSAGPNGNLTAPSGTLVTSWALRSYIENSAGYGWTWESAANPSTTPSVVAEIRSSDGSARFAGSVTASSFVGSFSAPGSNTQVLYNNSGTIAGASGLVYSSGNVGIGLTSPASLLHVGPATNFTITGRTSTVYTGSDSETIFTIGRSGTDYPQLLDFGVNQSGLYSTISARRYTTDENKLILQPNGGNVGIGSTAPTQGKLVVNGGVYATSFTGSFSGTIAGYLPLAGGTMTGTLQMSNQILAFDQSGTRSWSIAASGGELNFTSGDGAGVYDFDNIVYSSVAVQAPSYYSNYVISRAKLRLWGTDTNYAIGFTNGVTFGGLNDYAITTQVNNDPTRGFWWGHEGQALSQGAMALTTDGNLTVAARIRVGYGASDTTTPSTYAIQASGDVDITGTLTAAVKSFVINHPTKADKKLQYGVLEGPEHSVYIRGRLKNTKYITLPDYWHSLVHEDSITVNITAIGGNQDIWVEQVNEHEITVGYEGDTVEYFYTVFAERKDVDKLITEFDKEI